jgi:hypothetical protein
MSTMTLKRIMELWEGIPVIYTITSVEGEWNTYHVNVKVRDEAKIHPGCQYFEGNYIVKSTNLVL